MSANTTAVEMDAALALLQLTGAPAREGEGEGLLTQESQDTPNIMPVDANANEMDAAHTLLQLQRAPARVGGRKEATALFFRILKSLLNRHKPVKAETREQETQANDGVQPSPMPEIQQMNEMISKLYINIRYLENQLNGSYQKSASAFVGQQSDTDEEKKSDNRSSSPCSTVSTPNKKWEANAERNFGASDDKVPIGHGYAKISAAVLRQIDWTSHTGATRKLLTEVFSRRVLATHSLTGKSSPAFPDKPAKQRLDPRLVDDIVQIVVERSRVPASVVRTSITTKCADESKMFRNRERS